MDYTTMTVEELTERRAAIAVEIDAPEADLDALEAEARAINEELEARKQAENKRNEIRNAVAHGEGEVTGKIENVEERHTMNNNEIRSSAEYVNAYAKYIKTGSDKECRALLTENADPAGTSGPLPVPTIVENYVRTAWENDPIMSRVRRTFVRGNLRVAFELSATPAAIHAEGAAAPAEETLVLGVVELIPETIKKWITISDEAVDMGGEDFVRYIYDELTYQIVRFAAAQGILDIVNAPAASTATAIGIPAVTAAPSVTAIPAAAANLSEEARDVVVIMNRLTEVEFLNAQAAGNFNIDPFAGLPRLYTSALPAYSAAESGATYAIIGDLDGLQFNYPNGDDVAIKWDDLSMAERDMVKVVGRQYAGHGITAPGRFVKLNKA